MSNETVVREIDLGVDADEVWDALVRDDQRREWMGGETELEVEPGGRGYVTEDDGTRREVLVDDVVPGRRLSFDWWTENDDPTHVELVIVPTSTGTRLTVTERALVPQARPGRDGLGMALRLAAGLRGLALV